MCTRLCAILTNELSYELEFSIAFYIQFLFVKISKNTKIQGNFQLLKMKELCDLEICPIPSIFTIEVCSSLAQLCFVNVNLAKHIWVSIIPSVWNIFNDTTKNFLSARAVQFLTNNKLKNNFMTTMYEAIILCEPKVHFESYVKLFNYIRLHIKKLL